MGYFKVNPITGKLDYYENFGTAESHFADAATEHAITDPADAPETADGLRDDLVTNTIPSIETALNNLGTTLNSVIAVLEAKGLMATE